MKTKTMKWLAGSSLTALALSAAPAYAQDTEAGTSIENNVSVTFSVGGTAQDEAATASDTFLVDRRVNLLVEETDDAPTPVSPNEDAAVTAFTVRNNSNDTLDFALLGTQQTGGTTGNGLTDNFDVTNLAVFVESGANAGYQPLEDVDTFIDELDPDTSIAVYVIGDIPEAQVTDDVAGVILTATAHLGDAADSLGAIITATSGGDTAAVDNVFADTAGFASGDDARDGTHSAGDEYEVLAAALEVFKTSLVISDPINGATDPYALPGAVIEYCIAVFNAAGGAAAGNLTINDPLLANITFDNTFGVFTNGTVTGTSASYSCDTTGAGAGTDTGNFDGTTVTGTIASVPAGEARTMRFRVTVD